MIDGQSLESLSFAEAREKYIAAMKNQIRLTEEARVAYKASDDVSMRLRYAARDTNTFYRVVFFALARESGIEQPPLPQGFFNEPEERFPREELADPASGEKQIDKAMSLRDRKPLL